eukprot:2748103-Prymnesium_polylepis.3
MDGMAHVSIDPDRREQGQLRSLLWRTQSNSTRSIGEHSWSGAAAATCRAGTKTSAESAVLSAAATCGARWAPKAVASPAAS